MLMYVRTEALLALSSKYTWDFVRVIFSQVDTYSSPMAVNKSKNVKNNPAVPMRRDGRSKLVQNWKIGYARMLTYG